MSGCDFIMGFGRCKNASVGMVVFKESRKYCCESCKNLLAEYYGTELVFEYHAPEPDDFLLVEAK